VTWGDGAARPAWLFGGVLQAIAVQLVQATVQSPGIEFCSACTKPFPPTGPTIPEGKAMYCGPCREAGEPENRRGRKHRALKTRAREMFQAGSTVREIAQALDRPGQEEMIGRWVKEPRRPNPRERAVLARRRLPRARP